MKIIADRFSQMTAPGVDHDAQISVLILLQLDKMIASSQASQLEISVLNQRQELRVRFIFLHLLLRPVQHLGLLALLEAMDQHKAIRLDLRSSRHGTESAAECIPLQVFISTRSGRRFLCGYLRRSRRLTCFRLDAVKQVTLLEKAEDYDTLLDQLNRNRQNFWGVSFQGGEGHRLDTLSMTLQVLRHLLSVQSALTLQDIRARTYREGFEESLLSIISKIESGAWNLFERDAVSTFPDLAGRF